MKVALLWNGDEDSDFMFGKVKGKFDVSFLLTFLHKEAYDVDLLTNIKHQCEKLEVPYFWAKMNTIQPEEYGETLTELKEEFGIEGIVTNGTQCLIEDACRTNGIEVIKVD